MYTWNGESSGRFSKSPLIVFRVTLSLHLPVLPTSFYAIPKCTYTFLVYLPAHGVSLSTRSPSSLDFFVLLFLYPCVFPRCDLFFKQSPVPRFSLAPPRNSLLRRADRLSVFSSSLCLLFSLSRYLSLCRRGVSRLLFRSPSCKSFFCTGRFSFRSMLHRGERGTERLRVFSLSIISRSRGCQTNGLFCTLS